MADKLYNYLDELLELKVGRLDREIEDLQGSDARYLTQIADSDRRAEQARESLIRKFTALEAALDAANSMLAQIRAQMDAASSD